MRKRFEQQMTLGRIPIGETKITIKKRSGALPGLCAALKEIFVNPNWNESVFEILEAKITDGKKKTGRPGMDLWQIFVLSQVRLCQCFEGFRFWDLRRWNDTAKMNEAVRGVNPATFSTFEVEKRVYQPYMIYPPIPYDETLIYNIIQNKGW